MKALATINASTLIQGNQYLLYVSRECASEVMKSVVKLFSERADTGYCRLVAVGTGTLTVEAFDGWSPTNGHLLVAGRKVPLYTVEVDE